VGEDPSTLRHDVEQARAHLGDTVDALAFKAAAPRRAAERAAATVRGRVSPAMAAGAAAVCLIVIASLIRERRGR
jgi:Protein of unknown function (DUF3618)